MKRQQLVVLLFAAALGAGAACAQRPVTRFPHARHLSELACGGPGQPECLTCASCHQGADERAAGWASPPASSCTTCHDKPGESVTLPPRPAVAARPAALDIVFDHQKHLDMPEVKGQCVKCHGGVVQAAVGATAFPPMRTCLGCHEHQAQYDGAQCGPCHEVQHLRQLKPVSFLSHDTAWMKRHGVMARGAESQCALCHAQTQCDACHDATTSLRTELRNPDAIARELVHRFDFLSRHALEARSQPGQCASCHQKTECDACHAQRGVSGALEAGLNPHPLNWASGVGPGSNLHGREARRDIGSCAACHDQGPATNCVRCHRVGGFGGTPHPPGWRSTQPPDAPACVDCHGGGL